MNRWILGILIVLVGVAVVAAIANNAYHAGVARGLAEGGKVPAPEAGPLPYRYYGAPYGYPGPFGFGFGFLFPLLFIFLIFGLLKGLFWGPRWGWYGPWRGGAPPTPEEWHRRAHEAEQERGTKA